MNRFLIYGCLLNLLAFEVYCADELNRSYEHILRSETSVQKNYTPEDSIKKAGDWFKLLEVDFEKTICISTSNYSIDIKSRNINYLFSVINVFLNNYNKKCIFKNCSFEKSRGFCTLEVEGHDIHKIHKFVESNLNILKETKEIFANISTNVSLIQNLINEQERLKILLEKEKTKSDKNYSLYLSVKNEKESLQVSYDSKQNTFQNLVESEKKLKKQLGEKESCIKLKDEELNKKNVFLNQKEKELNKEKENYDGLLNLYNKEKVNRENLEKHKQFLSQNLAEKENKIRELLELINSKDLALESKKNLFNQKESELYKLRSENRKYTNSLNEKIADLTENLSIKEKDILNLKEEKQRLTLKIDQQYEQMNAGVDQINKVIENNEKAALDAYQKKIEKYEEIIEGGKKVFEKEISLLKQEVAEKTKQLDLLRAEKFNTELNFVTKESYNDLSKKYSDLLDEFNKKDFPKDDILIKKPSEDKGFDLSVLEDKESLSTIYRAMKKCGYKKERPKDILLALKELQEHFEEQDGI